MSDKKQGKQLQGYWGESGKNGNEPFSTE